MLAIYHVIEVTRFIFLEFELLKGLSASSSFIILHNIKTKMYLRWWWEENEIHSPRAKTI